MLRKLENKINFKSNLNLEKVEKLSEVILAEALAQEEIEKSSETQGMVDYKEHINRAIDYNKP